MGSQYVSSEHEGATTRYFDASVGLSLEWVHTVRVPFTDSAMDCVVDEANVLRPVSSHVRQLLSLMPPSGVYLIPVEQMSRWLRGGADRMNDETPATQVEFAREAFLLNSS